MDSKFKGIVWVGNIYQRFEALCLEMDDMVCQVLFTIHPFAVETFQYVEDQLQTVGANVRQFCTELMQEVLPSSPTNSKEELNLSLLQNAAVTANKDSDISVNKDCIQKELIHVKYIKNIHLGSSSGQSTENERGLAQACKNEAHDSDSTLDDALLESKAVPKLELETVPASVPSHNKVKLEESCIVVDSSELHSLSNELQERRSFKEKFQEAFSLKSRLWKPDDEQHRNSVEQSSESNKSESQEMGFSESDWEII
ncbi:inner centromere protein A isoform X1 [Gossypium australe]|uniref:Inner centromere protein A isoform X1 n=1 Tax=Gossypium australe TaxID=47621 RepID=A0A5B6WA92_9ROSI|nr:inner centromere protein A isoform X1 [Gossypium australe]